MIGFSADKLREIAARGMLFEPNLLPESINHTIIGLCELVAKQQDEIEELRESISNTKQDCSNNKTELLKMNYHIDEINVKDDVKKLFSRLSALEESQREFKFTVNDSQKEMQSSIDALIHKNTEMEDDFKAQISNLTPEFYERPKIFTKEEDQPVIINNNLVDISPLIRGLYRDSRRVDSIGETIQTFRVENENVVNAVAAAQDNIIQFNKTLRDFVLSFVKSKTLQNDRASYFQSSEKSLEKQIIDIWKYISILNENMNNGFNNASHAIDEIQSILSRLSKYPIPTLTNLSDVTLECSKIQEKLAEKNPQFEFEREKFRHPPEDQQSDPILQIVDVDTIRNKTMYKNIDKKVDLLKQKFDESVIQSNMEDLRIKVNELSHESSNINNKFEELRRFTKQKIGDKVDIITMERLFNKYQLLLDKMSRKLENMNINSGRSNPISSRSQISNKSKDLIRMKSKIKNNDDTTTNFPQKTHEKPKSSIAAQIYGSDYNQYSSKNISYTVHKVPQKTAALKLASNNIHHNDYD